MSCSLVNGPDDLLAPPAEPGQEPELSCDDTTVEYEGECLPYDPNDVTPPVTTATPPGGTVIAAPFYVRLETDEPATIYYTVDGSEPDTDSPSEESPAEVFGIVPDGELKHFAIDRAGNREAVKTQAYPIDGDAPGPVTSLDATTQADVSLSWQNPTDADFAGVLVVRSGGVPAAFAPSAGTTYTVGQLLGAGQDVVFVGDASELVDDTPHGGSGYYTAWAFDQVLNYSTPENVTSVDVPILQPQQGAIEIDTAQEVATVTQTPHDFFLTADEVSYDAEAEELSFRLTITSLVGRHIHNPKLALNSLSQGTLFSGADGAFKGKPTLYFGPAARPPGTKLVRRVKARGVSGNPTVVTMTFEMTEHPTVRVGGGRGNAQPLGLSDSSGSGFGQALGCPTEHMPIPDGMRFQCLMGASHFSDDQRWLLVAFGSHPAVIKYDMETVTAVLSVELATAGRAYGLTPSPDGAFLYVTIAEGRHRKTGTSNIKGFGFDGDMQLVKLDAVTLDEVGRVTLASAVTTGLVRDLSITADGTRGAVALEQLSKVIYVDLVDTMAVLDTIDTPNTRPRIAAIQPDGAKIFVFYNQVVDAEIYDTAALSAPPTPLPILAGGSSPRLGGALFGPDGRLYLARRPGDGSAALIIFDPLDPITGQTGLYTGNQMLGIALNPAGTLLYGKTLGDQITALDLATSTPLQTQLAGARVKGHHLSVTR